MTILQRSLNPSARQREALLFTGVMFAVVWVYFPVLKAFFVADDFHYLRTWTWGSAFENLTLGRHKLFYRPLGDLALSLQYRFFEVDQRGYHLINLLFHAVVCLLLYRVVRRYLNAARATAVIALFGLAAIHARIVPWISNQFELLASIFMLLVLDKWLQYVIEPERGLGWQVYGWTVLGLLSKGTAIAIPVAATWLWFMKPGGRTMTSTERRQAWLKLLLLWGLIAGYLAYRLLVLGSVGVYGNAAHLRFDRIIPLHLADYFLTFLHSWFNFSKSGFTLPLLSVCGVVMVFLATLKRTSTSLLGTGIILLLPSANLEGYRFLYLASGFFIAVGVSLVPSTTQARWRRYALLSVTTLICCYQIVFIRGYLPNWLLAGEIILQLPYYVLEQYHQIPENSRLFFLGVPDSLEDVYVMRKGIAVHGICMMVLNSPRLKSFSLEESELPRVAAPPPGTHYFFFHWRRFVVTPREDLNRLFRAHAAYYRNGGSELVRAWHFAEQADRAEWIPSADIIHGDSLKPQNYTTVAQDPYLVCRNLNLEALPIRRIRITMAIEGIKRTALAKVYWREGNDDVWQETNSAEFEVSQDGATRPYLIDLLRYPAWRELKTLTGLRLDPTTFPAEVTIEAIELLAAPQPAEYTIDIPLEFPDYRTRLTVGNK